MSSWLNLFGGRKDPKSTARDAIVNLRQQLGMLEKKEEFTQKKIDEAMRTARANAVSNKSAATMALRRKKALETDLERIANTRLTLEGQVNALESANINQETMGAMKRGSEALKVIHQGLTIDKVDATMDSIREQMELTNEISDAIANPINMGVDIDEDELKEQLAELEQEELDNKLMGAERAPVHAPSEPSRVAAAPQKTSEEDEEEAQLRALQAEMAM
ncbi:Snf7-domain-containing protein [Dacryopinax primogenitus]|uniref:Vacuolar-sorting protein SNF7 n=1 Tax=Dacryopinax primogenitus (strain DJM 731) TaxID=1858805 RepID=M5FVV2_DACPD|nr:Snf7-domain-containing protein [Dacryopinax primogenitus]EJT97491.1 Snf7-domain-containing protein [Dacryopinax primogenitus]